MQPTLVSLHHVNMNLGRSLLHSARIAYKANRMPLSLKDTVEIAPGVHMPRIGFGVYKSPPETCVASCKTALQAGYRLIDSAMYYANVRG